MRTAIVDTGPLVAFLDRAEQNHSWVVAQIEKLDPPLLVCEPVLAEAMHLLARFSGAQNALFGLLENGALRIAFSIDEHVPTLRKLHQKYRNRPMSLADACIVRPGRDLRATRRADAGFRFFSLSQTWPLSTPGHPSCGSLDDR